MLRGISMVSLEEVIIRDFGSQAGITIRNLHSAVLCYDVYVKTRITGEVCLFVKNDQGETCEIAEVKDFRKRPTAPNTYMVNCQAEIA